MAGSRHFRLDDPTPHTGAVRFLSGLHVRLEEGKKTSWITLGRTGTFRDRRYGEFDITRQMLSTMVANFDAGVCGQDIFIDVAHRPDNGAAAKVQRLSVEGDRLRALVEWTPYGIDAVTAKGYAYLSMEYDENWQDNEKGEKHGPVLLGAGLTVRPVIKRLDPVQLSETGEEDEIPTLVHPELQKKLLQEIQTMWKELLKQLSEQLGSFKLAEKVIESLTGAAEKALANVTDAADAKALIAQFETSGKQLAEQIGDKVIQLDIKVPEIKTGLDAEGVKKLMADEARRLADEQAAAEKAVGERRKLLTDTIGAAEGLDDEMKKSLTEKVIDLVTGTMSEDQVKKLAAAQIATGNEIVAARTLAAMGYEGRRGTPHITVDSSNEIKALQEEVDKRLFARMPGHRRYALSNGVAIEGNKQIVEDTLKLFDAANGRRLHEEYKAHKQLAAGDGIVSDVAIPATFERTVIREALYQMVGLGLVDVGTAQYSAVHQLPYSYRDTTAAGTAAARKYEGQSIARAGVRQELEEARPIPQKIAFEVSDELRYLTSNGQIDFDILAENARNASRIIGEDTEQLLFDELLNAADQYLPVAVTTEAVATADGTDSIYPLAQFPVVRPKKVYDLQGNQVGSTLYPITITVNAVAISEYDGTGTQSAGIYYTMDYNLGEIHFVDEAGAESVITNTHAIVCTYHYASNVYKWDSDLGSLAVEKKYNDFLYRFGLRKALIEDRNYMPNVAVMSGTLRTQIEQSEQFGANFKRAGTDLMADGNLGRIKDIPTFRSYAPGLAMGDQRVVIGERGTTRFRMMKPWQMGQLENQKDANGRFTGKKEAYGDQFVVVHTPTLLKRSYTSMVVYSATARVDRAA